MSADRYVIGNDFPRIAEIELDGGRDGKYLLAKVHNGDGGEVAFHVRDLGGQWTQIAGFTDGVKQADVGDDGRLYAMSIKDAPLGRIIAIPLDRPALANAVVVVPEARHRRGTRHADEVAPLRVNTATADRPRRASSRSTASASATSRRSRFPTSASACG